MYSDSAKNNIESWNEIYEGGGFGNRYPSSYLVTLLYRLIKTKLPQSECKMRALDFGCSFGANSKMLREAGFEVYGIDISDIAIRHCIEQCGFDGEHFKRVNLLDAADVQAVFGVKFDLIIASECLYYFSKDDLNTLLEKFNEMMHEGSIIYGNMQTFNYGFYRGCQDTEPNEEGMYRIETSGAADKPLYVNLVKGKEDTGELFNRFEPLHILRHIEEVDDEYETIHYIGRKRNE